MWKLDTVNFLGKSMGHLIILILFRGNQLLQLKETYKKYYFAHTILILFVPHKFPLLGLIINIIFELILVHSSNIDNRMAYGRT